MIVVGTTRLGCTHKPTPILPQRCVVLLWWNQGRLILTHKPGSRHCHLAIRYCTIRQRVFDCKYLSCKICFNVLNYVFNYHRDHLYGKPGNVKDFTKSQGNVREVSGKILSGKRGLNLFIVSCIFVSILDFAEFVHFILVSVHTRLHYTTDNNTSPGKIWVTPYLTWAGVPRTAREMLWNCQGISHCLDSSHPILWWNRWWLFLCLYHQARLAGAGIMYLTCPFVWAFVLSSVNKLVNTTYSETNEQSYVPIGSAQ